MVLFLLWQIFIVVSFYGLGELLGNTFLKRYNLAGYLVFVIGLSAFSSLCAVFMLMGIGGRPAWLVLLSIGFVFFNYFRIRHFLSDEWRTSFRQSIRSHLLVSFSMLVAALFGIHNAITRGWNPCDDEPAYLYLAKRIWNFGDLSDEFNNRRLSSNGLFSLIQGIVIGPFGEGALFVADELISLVLLAFVLLRVRRLTVLLPGSIALILVAYDHSYLGRENSSPVLLPLALLTVMVAVIFDDVYGACHKEINYRSLSIVFGALCSLIINTRTYFFAPFILIFLILAVSLKKTIARRLAIWAGVWSLVFTIPWGLVTFRDTAGVFFPIFEGNLSSVFPFEGYVERSPVLDAFLNGLNAVFESTWFIAAVVCFILIVVIDQFADRPECPRGQLV